METTQSISAEFGNVCVKSIGSVEAKLIFPNLILFHYKSRSV